MLFCRDFCGIILNNCKNVIQKWDINRQFINKYEKIIKLYKINILVNLAKIGDFELFKQYYKTIRVESYHPVIVTSLLYKNVTISMFLLDKGQFTKSKNSFFKILFKNYSPEIIELFYNKVKNNLIFKIYQPLLWYSIYYNNNKLINKYWYMINRVKHDYYIRMFLLSACKHNNIHLFRKVCKNIENKGFLYQYATYDTYRSFHYEICLLKKTPLYYAIYNNNIEMILYFIEKKICKGWYIIEIASQKGYLNILKLVENKINNYSYAFSFNNYSMFRYACRNGNLNIIKHLYNKGINIRKKGYFTQTYYVNIHHKFEREKINYFGAKQILIKKVFMQGEHHQVKHFIDNGLVLYNFSLKWACQGNHLEVVKFLIEKGADVTTDNNYPIRCASRKGNIEMMKYLISKGADITAKKHYAVRYASRYGHLNVVKLLVKHGSNISDKDNYALRLASMNGHYEVVKYICGRIIKPKNIEIIIKLFKKHSRIVEFLTKMYLK